MRLAADIACSRCRASFEEDDVREWCVVDECDFVCPSCVAPFDIGRGAEQSQWRTLAARLAAGHSMPTEMVLGILERRVRDGDRFTVRAWLHELAEENVHGVNALVELAVAAITLMEDES